MLRRRHFLAGIAATLAASTPVPAADEGFEPVFAGDDLSAFDLIGIGPETATLSKGVLSVTGKPNGYVATKKSYRDYVLRFDWMYERPAGLASDAAFSGNGGLLIHIEPPHKVWPRCIEVQLMYADAGRVFPVDAAFQGTADPKAQHAAARPVGAWNSAEVTSRGGAVVSVLNGIEVSRGTAAVPDRGPFAFQSEGAAMKFRDVRIKVS